MLLCLCKPPAAAASHRVRSRRMGAIASRPSRARSGHQPRRGSWRAPRYSGLTDLACICPGDRYTVKHSKPRHCSQCLEAPRHFGPPSQMTIPEPVGVTRPRHFRMPWATGMAYVTSDVDRCCPIIRSWFFAPATKRMLNLGTGSTDT